MHAPFYSDDNPRQVFYKDGFTHLSFEDGPVFRRLYKILRDMHNGKVKNGFAMEGRKGDEHAADLRPNPVQYDPVFIDILKEQKVFEKLKEITGRKFVLGNIKLRTNYPGSTGYGTWHRDTDFYRGNVKGNIPPLVNLHYYPHFDETPEPTLLIWSGSHRRQTDRWLVDRLTVALTKGVPVQTDDNRAVILETSALHKVTPTTYQNGALRLMYNFCEPFQFEYFDHIGEENHKRMRDAQF